MKVFVNDILEKLSEAGHEPKRFLINQELIQLNCYLINFYDKNA